MIDGHDADIQWLAEWLGDPANAEPCFTLAGDDLRAMQAGIYAWHGDEVARELVRSALGSVRVSPLYFGRIHAALQLKTGRYRLRNTKGSSFRCSLAALLWDELELRCTASQTIDAASNGRLTSWMLDHLSVTFAPVADRSAISVIEAVVLDRLDPPLNLNQAGSSPGRTQLRRLRLRHLTIESDLLDQFPERFDVGAVAERDRCVVVPISRATGKGSRRSSARSRRAPSPNELKGSA